MEGLTLRHDEAELRYRRDAAKMKPRKHGADDENTLLSGFSGGSHQEIALIGHTALLQYFMRVYFLLAHAFDGFSVFYLQGGFHRIDDVTDSRGKTTYADEYGRLPGTAIRDIGKEWRHDLP
ncbi:hypothetical protein [Pantoea sp. 1.19]|uniref:hypothetical protein n=1 Tax=Pantoea sp. 1.19 TaxID=1925589 RepID=UPI000948A94D|nr:hypothetical protein [Pantoea sp. 1.19]